MPKKLKNTKRINAYKKDEDDDRNKGSSDLGLNRSEGMSSEGGKKFWLEYKFAYIFAFNKLEKAIVFGLWCY